MNQNMVLLAAMLSVAPVRSRIPPAAQAKSGGVMISHKVCSATFIAAEAEIAF